jgi:hypothetical protein
MILYHPQLTFAIGLRPDKKIGSCKKKPMRTCCTLCSKGVYLVISYHQQLTFATEFRLNKNIGSCDVEPIILTMKRLNIPEILYYPCQTLSSHSFSWRTSSRSLSSGFAITSSVTRSMRMYCEPFIRMQSFCSIIPCRATPADAESS